MLLKRLQSAQHAVRNAGMALSQQGDEYDAECRSTDC
tara:strand:+ start:289 stop:399 length:111 start_codon:yes stop_codon:yes gene_type:complete